MKQAAKLVDDIVRRKDVFLALLRQAVPKVTVTTTENPPLNCLKCASFCCKLAGYVEVRRADIRRLAKHLGLTVRGFEEKHIVEVTRKGEKLIKSGYDTCQFLGDDRRCTVYSARPRDCREYVCWDQHDSTVYDFAYFYQKAVGKQRLRRGETARGGRARRARARARRRRKRGRSEGARDILPQGLTLSLLIRPLRGSRTGQAIPDLSPDLSQNSAIPCNSHGAARPARRSCREARDGERGWQRRSNDETRRSGRDRHGTRRRRRGVSPPHHRPAAPRATAWPSCSAAIPSLSTARPATRIDPSPRASILPAGDEERSWRSSTASPTSMPR